MSTDEASKTMTVLDRSFAASFSALALGHVERPYTHLIVYGLQDLQEPALHRGFERSYGWAWLLKLAAELHAHPEFAGYGTSLDWLSGKITELFAAFLPKATYPVRGGAHFNTAFAL